MEEEYFAIRPSEFDTTKCYAYSIPTREEENGDRRYRYFSTTPPIYLGQFLRYARTQQISYQRGVDTTRAMRFFFLNAAGTEIALDLADNMMFKEVPCADPGPATAVPHSVAALANGRRIRRTMRMRTNKSRRRRSNKSRRRR
jgi:hypothetical protein